MIAENKDIRNLCKKQVEKDKYFSALADQKCDLKVESMEGVFISVKLRNIVPVYIKFQRDKCEYLCVEG